MSFMKRLKAIDAFPKIQEDFYSKTMSGGIITIVCSAMMVILFLSELGLYLTSKTIHKLEVDTSRGEKITINLDITLPRMPCEWVSVDAVDASGRVQTAIEHEVFRQRLSSRGRKVHSAEQHDVGPRNETLPEHLKPDAVKLPENYCGSCYGAEENEGDCCNTCESVRGGYQKKGWVMPEYDTVEQCKREGYQDSIVKMKNEGCRLWGKIQVAKVAGRVQLIPGKTYEHAGQLIPDLQALKNQRLDISHTITSLSFGEKGYPGQVNPLAGATFDQRKKTASNPNGRPGLYTYNVKVVPTSYQTKDKKVTESNQYSASDTFFAMDPQWIPHAGIPGIMLFYDMSAIKVDVVEKGTPFLHFVTNVCAIVGGLWAMSGLIDSTVYHGQKLIKKKIDIGKYG